MHNVKGSSQQREVKGLTQKDIFGKSKMNMYLRIGAIQNFVMSNVTKEQAVANFSHTPD